MTHRNSIQGRRLSAVSKEEHKDFERRMPEYHSLRPVLERIVNGSLGFNFVFQPIVDVRKGSVAGYEALVRFPAEVGMSPDKCFEAAAACGMRQKLERSVLSAALEAKSSLPENTFLTVNASPGFLLSEDWAEILQNQKSLAGVVIEITEQDSIHDYPAMRAQVAAIRNRGGFVAVDDTGAGYASLKHMMELAPNFLKLDRYFIGECHSVRAKSTLIEMIGKVASSMDAWIVAEGVENSDELDELIRLSVPLVQGYHLGRPDPAMRLLPDERATTIRSRVMALAIDETIGHETETCSICHTTAEAASLLRQSPSLRHAAVLDAWGRPIRLFERHPLLGTREVHDLMRVQIASSAAEVLQRALMRSEASRFDCLAVINEQGRFQGIVRMDRLIRTLLEKDTSTHGVHDAKSAMLPMAWASST